MMLVCRNTNHGLPGGGAKSASLLGLLIVGETFGLLTQTPDKGPTFRFLRVVCVAPCEWDFLCRVCVFGQCSSDCEFSIRKSSSERRNIDLFGGLF